MSESIKKQKRIKQFIVTFTPFFILTLLFIGFNFWPGWLNQFNQPTVVEVDSVEVTKGANEPRLGEAEQVELETAVTSTTTPPPTSTPFPQSTLPPETNITLNGPPQASVFPNTSNITFYWNWPLPLADNQQFALTMIDDAQEQQIATINEQNLGQQYALTVNIGTLKSTAPESLFIWQIQLIDSESGTILAQSKQRQIAIISQANQQ